jgi:hypothetical protein
MGLADALLHAIQSVDVEQPTDDIFPLDDLVDTDIAPRRTQAALVGGLALLALVIASVGVYGVMAYLVSQRTQEMGIRMALGAQRKDVVILILSRGAKIAPAGVPIRILVSNVKSSKTKANRSWLCALYIAQRKPNDTFVEADIQTSQSETLITEPMAAAGMLAGGSSGVFAGVFAGERESISATTPCILAKFEPAQVDCWYAPLAGDSGLTKPQWESKVESTYLDYHGSMDRYPESQALARATCFHRPNTVISRHCF